MDGDDHKPLWDLAAGRKFIADMLTGAEPIYLPMHDWCDIPKAAQRLRIGPGAIVALILDRQVARVGRYVGKEGYTSILVDLADVERHLQRPEAKGLSIELFAKTNGLKPSTASFLVKNGHIASTLGTNPKTKKTQRFLSPSDIGAFNRTFVPLRALATRMGLSWQQLRQDLLAACIMPFTPDGHDLGAIYQWSEIEETLWCRWPRVWLREAILEGFGPPKPSRNRLLSESWSLRVELQANTRAVTSAAFALAAVHAGHAAFDHPQFIAAAAFACLARAAADGHDLGLGIGFQAHALALDEADRDEVPLDHAADRREDRGDIAPLHPCAAARIEHGLQLFHHEGHIAAATEHRRDHPR